MYIATVKKYVVEIKSIKMQQTLIGFTIINHVIDVVYLVICLSLRFAYSCSFVQLWNTIAHGYFIGGNKSSLMVDQEVPDKLQEAMVSKLNSSVDNFKDEIINMI